MIESKIKQEWNRPLSARPGLADVLVSFAGDYVPPRELLRPSVWRRALTATASGA